MKIEELMNRYYGSLNENDRLICQYIRNHKDSCYRLSIDEFAQECHVSKTVLFRFAKKLSLPGFSELKVRLRWEAKENREPAGNLLKTVTDSYHKMIDTMMQKDFSALFDRMEKADRILVYGSGYAQARVASELKRIFLPCRKHIFHIHGYDMVKPLSRLATEKDLVIIISLSGESKAVLELASDLRLRCIPMVSVTGMRNNALSSMCNEQLYIHSIPVPDSYVLDYEISTPYFILIEILYLRYQDYLSRKTQL